MDEDLWVSGNRDYSSEVLVPVVSELGIVAGPVGQSSDHGFMLLKLFHSGTVFDVDCVDASITVSYEELSLPGIYDHGSELGSAAAEPSIHTLKFTVFGIPYLDAVRVHCYKTKESQVEEYFDATFLVCQKLIFGLIVFKVEQLLACSNNSLFHRMSLLGRVGETEGV